MRPWIQIGLLLWLGVGCSVAAEEVAAPALLYWNSAAGQALRSRMAADADYWRLSPWFAEQVNPTYCSVASAITVLNALPIAKPVDPIYAPHAYFTQNNFFTPAVTQVISAQTVRAQGMTRDELTRTLNVHGVHASSMAGDQINESELRELLKQRLRDDGHWVLANYLRTTVGQQGGGHWSVLAAYDEPSDRVLILDVAKYLYEPAWVTVAILRQAMATLDSTSHQARGLVVVTP